MWKFCGKYSFRIACLFTKFAHQEISWNDGLLRIVRSGYTISLVLNGSTKIESLTYFSLPWLQLFYANKDKRLSVSIDFNKKNQPERKIVDKSRKNKPSQETLFFLYQAIWLIWTIMICQTLRPPDSEGSNKVVMALI